MSRQQDHPDDLEALAYEIFEKAGGGPISRALTRGANAATGLPGWVLVLSELLGMGAQQEARDFWHTIARRLQAVEEQLRLPDPDHAKLVVEILEKASSTKQREKVDYWAALAGHIAVHESAEVMELRRFVDTLEVLRPSHLRLLHVIATGEPPVGYSGGGAVPYLAFMMPDVPVELIPLDWTDLVAHGLVSGLPTGMTVNTPDWQRVQQSLTVYGRRFIESVEA